MIQRSENTPWTTIEGEVLMMSIEQGQYFSLNEVGSRIWDLLETPTEPTALIEKLTAEYAVSTDVCSGQVDSFLAGLRNRGLLVEVD
jgi:hypothetical protein